MTSNVENGIVSHLQKRPPEIRIFSLKSAELPCKILNLAVPAQHKRIETGFAGIEYWTTEESKLANFPQSRKRARQGEKRRRHNASFRSMVRTYIKKVDSAIAGGDQKAATEAYNAAVPVIDRMASKGIIHKNKAARHKSRLNTAVKALQ